MTQPLVFRLAFRVIDDATSGIRRVSDALRTPAVAIGQIAKAAGQASQQFANSFTGMGAVVAGGFSLKAVASQAEFWRRMQINSGMSDEAIARLRGTIDGAAAAARISGADMMGAFKAFKSNGGSTAAFEASAQTMAAAIQLLNGHGEELGEMFANLNTKMGVSKGEDFLDFLATARMQLAGIDGGMDNFAASSQLLMSTYAQLGHTGTGAAKELSAVYAVIARGTGSAKQARSATEGFLQNLGTYDYQKHLAAAGIRVWNDPSNPRSGVRSATDIVQQIAAQFAEAPARAEQIFGKEMKAALKVPIAEIKATGKSATLDKAVAAQGDGADFLRKSEAAAQGLSGSLNALDNATRRLAVENLTGPINLFAAAVSACTGPIATVVMALAALAAVGHLVGWIAGAVAGFTQFVAVIKLIRLGAAVSAIWGMMPALGAAAAATWTWTAALLACPVTWIILAIVALAGAVYLIYRHWDGISAWFAAKWQAVKEAFGENWLLGVVKLLSEFNPVSLVAEGVNALVKWLFGIDLAESGRNIIRSLIKGMAGVIDLLPDSVKSMIGLDGTDLGTALGNAGAAVADTAGTAWSGVRSVGGAVAGAADSAWSGVKSGVSNAGAAIAESGTAKQVMAFFAGKGWSAEQAAGIAANLGHESNYKTNAIGDSGKAYGVAQWHPDRQAKFAAFAGKDIRQSTLEDQLAFVHHELTAGAERGAGKALGRATSAAEAGAIVSRLYERPADREGEAARRGATATALASNAGPAGATPPSAFASAPPAKAEVGGTITVRLEGMPAGAKATVAGNAPGLSVAMGMGPTLAGVG